MKTLNKFYSHKKDLFQFIHSHALESEQNLLIQIFTGSCDKDFIQGLISDLSFKLPKAQIVGMTTKAGLTRQGVSAGQTLINFTAFEHSRIKVYAGGGDLSATSIGRLMARSILSDQLKAVVTFATTGGFDAESYLEQLEQVHGGVPLAGGLAGSAKKPGEGFVFTHEKIITNGAVAVSFHGEKLRVHSDYSFGWESIGMPMRITKAEQNRICSIDDTDALQVYATYLGEDIAREFPGTGTEFPLLTEREGITVARAVLNRREDGSLETAAKVCEGEQVYFGFGNVESILEQKDALAQRLCTSSPEATFIYACSAREQLLHDMFPLELEALNRVSPLSGCLSSSEFFREPKSGRYHLLNHTLTLIAFSENPKTPQNFSPKRYVLTTRPQKTIKALSTLIGQTSRQLNRLNKELEQSVYDKTTQLRKNNKKLLQRVYYDDLTMLGNRTLLLKSIEKKQKNYALVLIDANNFKDINDLYGITRGDLVLQKLAQILQETVADTGLMLFRVSGDEFAILNKKPTDKSHCEAIIEKIDEKIKATTFTVEMDGDAVDIYLSAAMGFAYKTSSLLEHASMALVKAKQEGAVYREYRNELELEKRIEQNIHWTKVVKKAIEQDRVKTYFQPILTNGEEKKYETLMRIESEEGEVISPFFFLDIAKKNGDYHKLTKLVVQQACETFASKKEKFSLNLTYEDMANAEVSEFIKKTLQRYRLADRVIFEIVESEYIKNFERVHEFLDEMKGMGVEIAIDDFGSGYANFSYLLELQPEYIKIDGSIMKNIHTDPNSLMIAETITIFAKKLGAKTIGEFIHSQEVLEKAVDIGVDSFQGFLLGKPVPLPEK